MSTEFSTGGIATPREREVHDFFTKKLDYRRPHERQWYVTRASLRGQAFVAYSDADATQRNADAPPHRQRTPINRMLSKYRARQAKFLKNRAIPMAVPASTDIEDRLNARATTKALEYQWRNARLESKYREALDICNSYGHAYWWFHWDDSLNARIQVETPAGESEVESGPFGDIKIEVVSPFEVVVDDPTIAYIGDQPRIGRMRLLPISFVKQHWGDKVEGLIEGDGKDHDAFLFKQRVGSLTSSTAGLSLATAATDNNRKDTALIYELYERPDPEHPKGRYTIMVNMTIVEEHDELPHGFSDLNNPYPCVDFMDFVQTGQYWITTIAEQMVAPQREYNTLRSKIAEHMRLYVHPKLLVAKQSKLAQGVWTSDSGEIIEYVALPGIPPPTPWVPPPMSGDVWRILELIIKEFDDVTHIFPEAEGRVGSSTSGFQTNLLQEATDAVHGPDIRAHELVIEEAAVKLRRMMKEYYDVPRLLTIAGKNMQPEVLVFSQEQIDDFADIRVEAGSSLPTLKAAKIQMINELWQSGLLGSPENPEDVRRVRAMLEMGTIEDQYDYDKQDDELARIENAKVASGEEISNPEPFENHELHYKAHTDQLKSPASKQWPKELRMQLIRHTILHARYVNPQSALMLASEYQQQDLVQAISQMMAAAQQATGGAPQPPQQPQPPAPQQG